MTKFFCDRCGVEAKERLPGPSGMHGLLRLQFEGDRGAMAAAMRDREAFQDGSCPVTLDLCKGCYYGIHKAAFDFFNQGKKS